MIELQLNIHFIQVSDHITYRIEAKTGERFLLRLHSEVTPKVEIVMRWVEGDHKEGNLSDTDIAKMGQLMARLHLAAESFLPTDAFARPVWGEQSFGRSVLILNEYYSTFLSDDEFQLYMQAAEKVTGFIANLQASKQTYGMIHADLHAGNIVFERGEPYPIDFGRCGFGYFMYDIAQSLVGLYPHQRRVFLDGYQRIRGISSDYVRELESFFVMAVIENYSFHAPNPEETEHLKAQQPYSQAILQNYLSATPFLFDAI